MALFKRKHVELILQGRKTQTRRVHHHEWKLGSVYGVRDKLFGKPVAHIMVVRKFRQRLGDISAEDVKKEGYYSLRVSKSLGGSPWGRKLEPKPDSKCV